MLRLLAAGLLACCFWLPGCAWSLNDWIDPEATERRQHFEQFEREQRWYDEQRQTDPSLPPRRVHGGII